MRSFKQTMATFFFFWHEKLAQYLFMLIFLLGLMHICINEIYYLFNYFFFLEWVTQTGYNTEIFHCGSLSSFSSSSFNLVSSFFPSGCKALISLVFWLQVNQYFIMYLYRILTLFKLNVYCTAHVPYGTPFVFTLRQLCKPSFPVSLPRACSFLIFLQLEFQNSINL